MTSRVGPEQQEGWDGFIQSMVVNAGSTWGLANHLLDIQVEVLSS